MDYNPKAKLCTAEYKKLVKKLSTVSRTQKQANILICAYSAKS